MYDTESIVAKLSVESPDVGCEHSHPGHGAVFNFNHSPTCDTFDLLEKVLEQKPFAGRTRVRNVSTNLVGQYDYAIALPARNEEALLPRAISALTTSMRHASGRGAAVFVVNNTSDRSADLAAKMMKESGNHYAILEVDFAPDIRNAPHARRLAFDIAAQCAPDGHLLTSDADSYVGESWVRTCRINLESGFGLVCEDVRLDEAELSQLPIQVRKVGDAERAYFDICALLWQRWTGDLTAAFAYRASGASLACTTRAYRQIGGLPTPSKGEDGALCDKIIAAGHHVCQLRDVGTRTSARVDARAEGGCGQTLLTRAQTDNPECDRGLIPLDRLREQARQHVARRRLGSLPNVRPMRYREVVEELKRARKMLRSGV